MRVPVQRVRGDRIQGSQVPSTLASDLIKGSTCVHHTLTNGKRRAQAVAPGIPWRGLPGDSIKRRKTNTRLSSDRSEVSTHVDCVTVRHNRLHHCEGGTG